MKKRFFSSRGLLVDMGTSCLKVASCRGEGSIKILEEISLPHFRDKKGRLCQDPVLLWEILEKILKKISGPYEFSAFSSQRSSFLFWERASGRPLTPLISWKCRSGEKTAAKLEQQFGSVILHRTGLKVEAGYPASKVIDCLGASKNLREKARRGALCFGTLDSWIIHSASSGALHQSVPTQASRTLFFNLRKNQWDRTLLRAMDIPVGILPKIVPHRGGFGFFSLKGKKKVPLTVVMGDQQASFLGSGILNEAGGVKVTLGTGGFVGVPGVFPRRFPGWISMSAYPDPLSENMRPYWEGVVLSCGEALDWARKELGFRTKKIPLPRGSLLELPIFLPALRGLGAPHWRIDMKAGWRYRNKTHTRGDLLQGVLTGIGLRVGDILERMSKRKELEFKKIFLDGGLSNSKVMCQRLADVTGLPIALGAQAHLGLRGLMSYQADRQVSFKEKRIFSPKIDFLMRKELKKKWKKIFRGPQ